MKISSLQVRKIDKDDTELSERDVYLIAVVRKMLKENNNGVTWKRVALIVIPILLAVVGWVVIRIEGRLTANATKLNAQSVEYIRLLERSDNMINRLEELNKQMSRLNERLELYGPLMSGLSMKIDEHIRTEDNRPSNRPDNGNP